MQPLKILKRNAGPQKHGAYLSDMQYIRTETPDGWAICEAGKDFENPSPACTFAFDTETFAYIDGVKVDTETLARVCLDMETEEKRRRVSTSVWCWQCYDEINGFFMTSSFDMWLQYQARAGYKFGWCYNAKFDFAQIDYKVLTDSKWTRHKKSKGTGQGYNKGQAWTFDSVHNDMGTRYAYKLWIEYRHKNRHLHVHPVEYRDFMNIFAGGLARMLESLDVRDENGKQIRKLSMDYQAVDINNLTQEEIDYCMIDVKGLYYGIKQYNVMIEEQSNGERHIFGGKTNVMTAGGFAKAELLRSLYPDIPPKKRIKMYQKDHPLTEAQDLYLRNNHLYRGGITLVNPRLQGLLLTSKQFCRPMNRYDVNSEYPYAMSVIRDLVGRPEVKTLAEWDAMTETEKEEYECILLLTSVSGSLKKGYIPVWYDPFRRDYVEHINEIGLHLMYEREFEELSHWYDIEYTCKDVLLYKRGGYAYKSFVDENYALKAEAKRTKNTALSNVVKLKLNSSYGKLAERVVRTVGEYRINEETGAVHFVQTGEEHDAKGIMNVAVGALVTAVARIWILKHIREICGESNMTNVFVYIDTDSIHAFADYAGADPYKLGGLKLEASCNAVKYLCPKTYFDAENVQNNMIAVDNNKPAIELHAKGINISSVKKDFANNITPDGLPLDYVNKRFDYGQKYPVLCAMNVVGGKVLLPSYKYLARDEQNPHNPVFVNTGYDGNFISEV